MMDCAERERRLTEVSQPGDVITTDTKTRNLFLRIVYGAIQKHSRYKYPNSKRTGDIHAMLVLETDPVRLFSCEPPYAIIKPLEIEPRTVYRVCRYRPAEVGNLPDFQLLLREAAERLKGLGYDYGQLGDIGWKAQVKGWFRRFKFGRFIEAVVHRLFPGVKIKKVKLFDMGRRKKVCSVAVLWCFLYWWRNYWRNPEMKGEPIQREELALLPPDALKYPRPLGKQYVETCCPADFANHEETFRVVIEGV